MAALIWRHHQVQMTRQSLQKVGEGLIVISETAPCATKYIIFSKRLLISNIIIFIK